MKQINDTGEKLSWISPFYYIFFIFKSFFFFLLCKHTSVIKRMGGTLFYSILFKFICCVDKKAVWYGCFGTYPGSSSDWLTDYVQCNAHLVVQVHVFVYVYSAWHALRGRYYIRGGVVVVECMSWFDIFISAIVSVCTWPAYHIYCVTESARTVRQSWNMQWLWIECIRGKEDCRHRVVIARMRGLSKKEHSTLCIIRSHELSQMCFSLSHSTQIDFIKHSMRIAHDAPEWSK